MFIRGGNFDLLSNEPFSMQFIKNQRNFWKCIDVTNTKFNFSENLKPKIELKIFILNGSKYWNESNSMQFFEEVKKNVFEKVNLTCAKQYQRMLDETWLWGNYFFCYSWIRTNKIEQFLWSSTHMSNRISGASWRTRRSIILSIVMTRYRPVFSHFSF